MRQRELGSYDGLAKIALEGAAPVEVVCHFTVTQDMVEADGEFVPGAKGWRGAFVAQGFMMSSGAGTLSLPDGRSGQIVVTHVRAPGGRGAFTGSGEPPVDAAP